MVYEEWDKPAMWDDNDYSCAGHDLDDFEDELQNNQENSNGKKCERQPANCGAVGNDIDNI